MAHTLDEAGAILVQVLGATGAIVGGSGANTQVAYWTAANTLDGDAGFTYDPATDTITLAGGFVMNGGASSVITVNDNVANAFTLVDAGGIEYLRLMTANAQPLVVWNEGGADVDYRIEAVGVANALFIRGSDGNVAIGIGLPVHPFHIERAFAGNFVAKIYNTSVTGYGLRIQNADDARAAVQVLDATGATGNIQLFGDGDAYFAGGVGIGQAVPTGKVHAKVADGAAIPVLTLEQLDVGEEMAEFITTIGVGNAIEAVNGKTLTTTHFIKISIPGPLTRYIPVGTIA